MFTFALSTNINGNGTGTGGIYSAHIHKARNREEITNRSGQQKGIKYLIYMIFTNATTKNHPFSMIFIYFW